MINIFSGYGKHTVQDTNNDKSPKEMDNYIFEQFPFPPHFQKIKMHSMVQVIFFEVIAWSLLA